MEDCLQTIALEGVCMTSMPAGQATQDIIVGAADGSVVS